MGGSRARADLSNALFVPLEPVRARYDMDCSAQFDSASARVLGTEEITLTNTSVRPLDRLALAWLNDGDHSLSVATRTGSAVQIRWPAGQEGEDSPAILILPQAIEQGQELELVLRFERRYAVEPGTEKYLWTSWFPRIDWGRRSQDDFALRLDFPSEYTFACSGSYDSDSGTWRAEGVREFGLFFMKNAQVLEARAGEVAVKVIHTAAGSDCARLLLDTAVDVIGFNTQRFGFFPSDHIDVLPGAEQPMGGYPPATNLVVIHGMERMAEREELHWRWIMAHELGHQYWYEHVLSQPRGQFGWLMIGLGIYVDREYVRARHLAPDKHLELMKRYTDGVLAGLDTRADVYDDELDRLAFDYNNVVVHGKGYSIISALDCLLGEKQFGRIHDRCLKKFAGRTMSYRDFQSVCEEESAQDLDWFFDQWVRSRRFLSYRIAAQACTLSEGEYHSEVRVERKGTLDMPVPVTATFADSTELTAFTDRLQDVSVVCFRSEAPLSKAVIDAKHELAMVDPPPSRDELELRQRLSGFPKKSELDSIPRLVERALSLDIRQTLFWGQLGRTLYDWGFYDEALAVFIRRTELLEEMGSDWVMSGYGWQGLLLDRLGRRDQAVAAYRKALQHQTDREFSYEGDPVTISAGWLRERMETPFRATGDQKPGGP